MERRHSAFEGVQLDRPLRHVGQASSSWRGGTQLDRPLRHVDLFDSVVEAYGFWGDGLERRG